MEELFIDLLQLSLGTRERLSRVPSAREWEGLYELAEKQAVVGILLTGLERLPEKQLPPLEVKLQWIGEVQMMEAEYKLHCERAADLTRRFRAVGFRSCVLKGVGMAQYYPEPSRRQCGDIDLWVDGRRKDVMVYLRSEYAVDLIVWHHIDAKIFEDVPTEIHVHPAWMYGPVKNHRLQQFFERNKDAQMVVNENMGFAHTTARFDTVFSLVHSFHHLLEEGIGLRHIVDYYYVLRKSHTDSTDLTDILRVQRSIGLMKFAGAVMWILKEVCGMSREELLCEPNEKEGRFLLEEIMAGGNFGQTRTDGKIRNSFSRGMMMVRHYPSEVLWMMLWKVWHRGWMMINR